MSNVLLDAINLSHFDRDFTDTLLQQAISEIYSTTGDLVSVSAKAKALDKFGQSTSIGTSWQTVALFQGSEINETFVSTNLIDSISSSAQADTSKTYVIEGHTIDASGNLTFKIQNATTDATDGRTKVALEFPLARATRMYLANSGTFNSPQAVHAGVIYVYDDTDGITAGVPNTAAATKILLAAGATQSEKAATAISKDDYWIITQFEGAVASGTPTADYLTFRMEYRDIPNGGAWRPMGRDIVAPIGASPPGNRPRNPYLWIRKSHDWRVIAKTNSGTAPAWASAQGFLASVVKEAA